MEMIEPSLSPKIARKSTVKLDLTPSDVASRSSLEEVDRLTFLAERRWSKKLVVEKDLSRSLVSFQANKGRAVYRWFKFKEAFSASLVEYLLNRYRVSNGVLLDPFAGSGTALFAAGNHGMRAEGIELLPIGQRVIATKQLLDWDIQPRDIGRLEFWLKEHPWKQHSGTKAINELRITRDAYPKITLAAMSKYLSALEGESSRVQDVLTFALLCVLESISFTRKDGQYLRWDHRSGRRQGKKSFDKGQVLSFDKAIHEKLKQIVDDLHSADMPEDLFGGVRARTEISLHTGSCLDVLPKMIKNHFDCIVTSPPYCNRYDYTRTYALELALLGVDEEALIRYRQDMLSCTVENRAKDLLALNKKWETPITVCNEHVLLQAILGYLEDQREQELLNNNGIPRMVRGYFYEMACVIAECARVLKRGAPLMMVNDNVRYAGASVSVDVILSEIAERLGFETDQILVLPNGKGNSSQQMGAHGREPLRKCVYVWRKV